MTTPIGGDYPGHDHVDIVSWGPCFNGKTGWTDVVHADCTPRPQPQLPAIPTPLERELHVGLAADVAAPGAVVPGGPDLMPGARRDPLLVARVDRQVRLALEAAQLRADLEAARAELARVTESDAHHRRACSAKAGQLARVTAVHAEYFDMEVDPWDACPEPEDVWRYDRDFRAALLAPTDVSGRNSDCPCCMHANMAHVDGRCVAAGCSCIPADGSGS